MIRVATAVALLALGLVSKTNLGETHWATIVVFIAAYLVAGYDVLWRAISNIRRGEVFDENFLMTVASVGAMCVAEYAEGVAVMVLYQIGEYFQDKAVDKSRESITKLMDIRPDYANLVDGNDSRRVSPEQVRVGDIILVKPGEKIPLDGVVIEGNSSLNTTALTGESLPRDVKEGDQVLSGCVNLSGVESQGHGRLRRIHRREDSGACRILRRREGKDGTLHHQVQPDLHACRVLLRAGAGDYSEPV